MVDVDLSTTVCNLDHDGGSLVLSEKSCYEVENKDVCDPRQQWDYGC